MLTPKAFENWAIGKNDNKGDIITQQRINAAHKELYEKHPHDLPLITRKMVMGFFNLELLDFEKKYFPILYAARMQVQRLEEAPPSKIEDLENPTQLDAELCEYKQICLHKKRGDFALALYKRNRLPAETYANFCLEYFDTSVDKVAHPAKQATAPKQNPQVLRYTPTSPPPSYAFELHDVPSATELSFTAELEAAPVKAAPVLLPPPPPNPVANINASGGSTKFDAELGEYKDACRKTKGDLAYALYSRSRFSEEEYTRFCAEYREGEVPK
ncbi:hypothetical protein EAE96_005953 [Botrytis aclada]|nr:hypothetical protein EAE96_005953 [Botrytis aclada]